MKRRTGLTTFPVHLAILSFIKIEQIQSAVSFENIANYNALLNFQNIQTDARLSHFPGLDEAWMPLRWCRFGMEPIWFLG